MKPKAHLSARTYYPVYFILLCVLVLILQCLTGCAKKSDTESFLPTITSTCTTSNCTSAGSNVSAYVWITGSGCSSIAYDLKASSSKSVTCTGAGCSTTFSSYVDATGAAVSKITDGAYYVCTVFFTSGYSGTSPVDAYQLGGGEGISQNGVAFSSSQTSLSINF